jgi:hypothetical protein
MAGTGRTKIEPEHCPSWCVEKILKTGIFGSAILLVTLRMESGRSELPIPAAKRALGVSALSFHPPSAPSIFPRFFLVLVFVVA